MVKTINDINLDTRIPRTINQMFVARRALSKILIDQGKVKVKFDDELSLNNREVQSYIKEIIGNLGEELYEAVHEVEQVTFMFLQPNMIAIREEFADVMHFFFELFLYSNITEYTLFMKSVSVLSQNDFMGEIAGLPTPEQTWPAIRRIAMYNNREKFQVIPYTPPPHLGNAIKKPEFQDHYLSAIQKELNLARYELKNRPWKNIEVNTNIERYQDKVLDAFTYFIMYLEFLGIADTAIEDFLCKNIINIQRANG